MEEREQYQLEKKKSRYWKLMIGFGVTAIAAPVVGLLGTGVGMIQSFDTMAISGGADPSALANNISLSLRSTAIGIILMFPSIFLFLVFLLLFLKKKKQLEPQAPPLPTEREQ